ncbi:MAG: hypothetical protein ABIR71_09865, partial [Chthoniobacterales bacterium]
MPNSTQTAEFAQLSTYSVNVGSATTRRLEILRGDITFTNAAYTVLSAIEEPPGLVFDNTTFTLASGQVNSVAALIGQSFPARVNLNADTLWSNTSTLRIGGNGRGSVAIGSRGTLLSGNTQIGAGTGGGDVLVDGPQAEWRTETTEIGGNSAGTLAIRGGGIVRGGDSIVGANANGVVTIDGFAPGGVKSTWDLGVKKLSIGQSGVGTVAVTGAGLLRAGALDIKAGSSLTVRGEVVGTSITRSELNLTLPMTIDGTFLLDDGAMSSHTDANVTIGSMAAANMTLRNGGSLRDVGTLLVGAAQPARLTADSVSFVSCRSVFIADSAGADGSTVVIDRGSLTVTERMSIGRETGGSGALEIKDGGFVEYTGLLGVLVNRGTVLVTGRAFFGPSHLLVATALSVGAFGAGNLTVSAGARVESQQDVFIDEPLVPSLPTVTVGGADPISGTGSTLVALGEVFIGSISQRARLVVTEDGKVSGGSAVIGSGPQSVAQVDVGSQGLGQPARFEVARDFNIGLQGVGTLTLRNGGIVSVGGQLNVGDRGTIRGNGTLSAPSRFVSNNGVIAPGLSPGLITIDANFTQSSG